MVNRTCVIEGCNDPAKALGMCPRHYGRWNRHGDPLAGGPGRRSRNEPPPPCSGIRDDNRIENLELWVTPQPKGQRPEDIAEWLVEHYPDVVARALRRIQR